MGIEYEVKVLDINIEKITSNLKQAGYIPGTVQNFQRYVFELAGQKNSWIRLRTDGTETTLALKEYLRDAIDGVRETEVVLSDFVDAHHILLSTGLVEKSYQENTRHNFTHRDPKRPQVSIDIWPGIPAYLEIEGKNEETVSTLVKELEVENMKMTSAPTSEVYKLYGMDILKTKHLGFSTKEAGTNNSYV